MSNRHSVVGGRQRAEGGKTCIPRRWVRWVVLACVALAGCQQRQRLSAPDDASAICLADPAGGTPVDNAIRVRQGLAGKLPAKPDEWIVVGRGWVRKARASADPGFYINVEACAAAALAVAPGHAGALELRALALMNGHRFREAQAVAGQILKKEPHDIIALGTLSDALLELGRFDEAAGAAQQMMDLRPDMASYSRASYFRWLEGDRPNARLFIRHALKAGRDVRDPEPTAWTFVQAGLLFWNDGDYDGADALFAEALKWVADYPSALVGRGRVALSQDRPRQAIEHLEKAYRVSPLPETAWLLGDAREMLGDAAAARADYDRVVQEGRRGDRLTLALFYATKDRAHDEALRLVEQERATRGGVYVDDTYAWVLYRAGRIAEARQASDRALALGTRDARLLYHAGAIRVAAGDARGLALVRDALALNPRFDWAGAREARTILNAHDQATHAH